MARSNARVIAFREFGERAGRPAFWLTTLFGVLLMIALIIGPGLLQQLTHPAVTVGSVGVPPVQLERLYQGIPHQGKLVVKPFSSNRLARSQVASGHLPGYFVRTNGRLAFVGRPNSTIDTLIAQINRRALLRRVAPAALAAIARAQRATQVLLVPLSPTTSFIVRSASIYVLGLVLFMLVLMYGMLIGMSVVEEKETRHAETLLTRVTADGLLAGKIIGVGALAFLQLFIWGVAASATFAANGGHLPFNALPASDLGLFLLCAIIGYAQYGSIFAGLAARASRTSELNQATTPLAMIVMVGYVGSALAASHPTGVMAEVLHVMAFIPFWAPILAFALLQLGGLPWWQLLLDIALQLAVIVWIIRFSADIFRRRLLDYRALAHPRRWGRRSGKLSPP